ncbi:MAG: acetamidase/formamidase [Ilumatobacter sp.]|jgi:acetamidase/formamidase
MKFNSSTSFVLQSSTRPDDGSMFVPTTPETAIWGRLPNRNDPPILRVASGTTLTFDTVSHEGILEDQGRDPGSFFGAHGVAGDFVLDDCRMFASSTVQHDPSEDGPHVITGPVAVEGAEPGDLLAARMVTLEPRASYGIVSNRHGKGTLPDEFPLGDQAVVSTFCPIEPNGSGFRGVIFGGERADGTSPSVRFPLDPFLGIMAVATDTSERLSSTPPGAHGGNLDIKRLAVGSTLYLPVQLPGAMFSVGDPHYAQGNGEVALTALEAPLRATIELTVVKPGSSSFGRALFGHAFAETAEAWIAIGLHTDLNEAMRMATRRALDIVCTHSDLDRATAYAYLSAAVDFEVSQVVDGVKGIHAVIPKLDLRQ